MDSSSPALLVVVAFVLIGFGASEAFCQDPPEDTVGPTPSATYHGSNIDTVDEQTGRLNLHIPLVIDKSQRGKLNFTYSLSYTSTGTWLNVITNRNNNAYLNIEPPKYGVATPALIMDGAPVGTEGETYQYPTGHYNTYGWLMEGGYGFGPTHALAGTRTLDGSGFVATSTYMINKEGIRFNTTATASTEDTNGNEFTYSGSGETSITTDTLGRTWTTTSGLSDVSGCPTGTVAPYTATTWTIPGPNNSTRTFRFCYSLYNIQTNFNDGYENYASTRTLMTGIVLPDGTTWELDYDQNSYGDLVKLVPPTGGAITYSWTTSSGGCFVGDAGTRMVQSRTTPDGIWQYTYPNGTAVVTDPLGNATVYSGFNCAQTPITQIQYYSGSSSGGTLLKTVSKTF